MNVEARLDHPVQLSLGAEDRGLEDVGAARNACVSGRGVDGAAAADIPEGDIRAGRRYRRAVRAEYAQGHVETLDLLVHTHRYDDRRPAPVAVIRPEYRPSGPLWLVFEVAWTDAVPPAGTVTESELSQRAGGCRVPSGPLSAAARFSVTGWSPRLR